MKFSEIIQALTKQYLPNIHTASNTASDTAVRLFHRKHEITSCDFNPLHLDPQADIHKESKFLQQQIIRWIANHPEQLPQEFSRSPLPLENDYKETKKVSRIKYYGEANMATSNEQHTYIQISNDWENSVFSKFLRLGILQKIGACPELNHPYIAFPLNSELDLEDRTCTTKFPLISGENLEDLIQSQSISYQQWLNIISSLYLILEQLIDMGIHATDLSFKNLQVSDEGYLKLINLETFTPTSDNTPSCSGLFGATHYLDIFRKITHQLSQSTHLTPQEHASLLSLTVNVMEVLRKGRMHFQENRKPTQSDLAEFHAKVLTTLQSTLKMPDLQASLSNAHDIPASQQHRILQAPDLILDLTQMAGKVDTAIEMGCKEQIELLLITNTITPDQVNEEGQTLLFRTCRFTLQFCNELIELLIHKFNANPNAQDKFGNTPLIGNMLNPAYPGLNFNQLLNSGADPNLADYKGNTPLHIAGTLPPKSNDSICLYISNDTSCFEMLQSIQQVSSGNRPSSKVPSSESSSMIHELLANGANPTLLNEEQKTSLDTANENGFTSLALELLDYYEMIRKN